MAEKDKTPKLRFAGFTDAWEQRRLGDVYEKRSEKNANLEYGKDKIISAAKMKLSENVKDSSDEYMKTYNIIQKGDIAFEGHTSKEFEYGRFVLNDLTNGIVSHVFDVFKPVEQLDCNFIKKYIHYEPIMRHVLVNSTSSARMMNSLVTKEFLKQQILLPKYEEQQKIGTFFSNLDNLIILHQRKYDKLVIVKKSMLEKMFPKDGANVPEIRFAGFTDTWEQRELSDYLDTSNEKNSKDYFSKSDVLSVSGDLGIINQIEFQGRSFAGASVSNYGIVDHGDVVYTKSPLKANPYGIIKTNKGKPGIVSTLYAVYKPKKNTNSNFVQCYFYYDYRLNKYLKPLVNKGAKNDMKVSDDNALTGLVIFPSYEEQTRIAEFFECLDYLFTLHRRKLEKLKNIKKSILEKMFV